MKAFFQTRKFFLTLVLVGISALTAPQVQACGFFCTEFFWDRVNPEWMEKMLAQDPSGPTRKTSAGYTPAHFAALYANDLEALRIFLQAKGANPNATDNKDMAPLFFSLQQNPRVGVTRVFLEEGAEPDILDPNGLTPLFYAGQGDFVRVLAEHGANPNLKSPNGVDPLLSAILNKRDASVVEALLEAQADPDARYDNGRRPLHFAILEQSDAETVRAIAKWAKKPNVLDQNKMAALHYAAKQEASSEVVEALLEGPKVDVNVKNHLGVTACSMAQISNPKIVPVFKKHKKFNGDC